MSYNGRKNHLTGNVLSDEWYTPKYIVDKCFDICNYKNKTIICPFDTQNSLFVQRLSSENEHLIYGINNFLEVTYDYDLLVTNPPFSIKEKVFKKCLDDGKEFVLVLPETFIFSVGFYNLLEEYEFHYKLYTPKQRVYFIDENGNQNRPNFHTVIIHVKPEFTTNTIEHFYSEVV